VDRDGLASKVVVETGISDDRWEQVTSGLKAGDRVIVGPAKELRGLMEGERVSQREQDEEADKADEQDAGDDDVEVSVE
jgi:HlyD family secretion protein